jgi:predicted dehydrogenase
MADRLRTAVIGAGHFGRFHAQKYASLPDSDLVAVCDVVRERAEQVAAECGVRALTAYGDLIEAVHAVSIVVPTGEHYPIARAFLDHGVHVLVEKPIAATLEQANDLVRLARDRGVVLQVGHLERFSSVRRVMDEVVTSPVYIEANRISPFRLRGTDVSIVLDLMIHDIDLILSLVDAPLESVDAVGAPVLSANEDIANSRLRFANGCVASITASRVSMKNERKMRIFQPNAYVSVDFLAKKVVIARKTGRPGAFGLPGIAVDERTYDEGDSLQLEIEAFLDSARTGRPPAVSGEEGRRALEAALMIRDSLETHGAFVRAHLAAHARPPA